MKFRSYAICCLFFLAFGSSTTAAPVHETERHLQELVNQNWIAELYQSAAEISVVHLAHEEFRSIPQDKTILLNFGDEGRGLFDQLISDHSAGSVQLQFDWIGHLFGIRSWSIGEGNSFFSISVHSTSSIPLPAALPLFFGALAIFCMVLVFLKRRKTR